MLPLATCGLFLALVPQSEPRCPTATIVASDAATGDEYGDAVSFYGDTLVVGATRDDDLGADSGSVYVYHRDKGGTPADPTDDAWIEFAKLRSRPGQWGGPQGDYFGESVILSGGTLLVGATHQGRATIFGSSAGPGHVYAFERHDNGTPGNPLDDVWIEIDRLEASNPVLMSPYQADLFGHDVALSGNTALVAAPWDDELLDTGAAYVFERDDNGTPGDPFDDGWVEIAKLDSFIRGDGFGIAVAIHEDTAFVGSSLGGHGGPGVVYVFQRDDKGTPGDPLDDDWIGTAEVWPEDPVSQALFGDTISAQPSELLVGATRTAVSGRSGRPGAAYFFARDDQGTPSDPFDDTWVQYQKVTGSDSVDGDEFGAHTIALVGDLALVGARSDDDRGAQSGCAFAFQRDDRGTPEPTDDVWTEVCKMAPVTGTAGETFGNGLALQGREAVISAMHGNVAAPGGGAAYHFDLDRPCDAYVGLRTGSGVTPTCLLSTTEPRLGTLWEVQVDSTVHPAPLLTVLLAYDRPLSPGTPMFAGELLVDLSSALHLKVTTLSSITGTDLFGFLVPDDEPALIGLHSFTQAVVVGRGEAYLCNALNVVLGY